MGALRGGPGGPWSTQNFSWVGHTVLGPASNWPVSLLVSSVKLVKKQIYV